MRRGVRCHLDRKQEEGTSPVPSNYVILVFFPHCPHPGLPGHLKAGLHTESASHRTPEKMPSSNQCIVSIWTLQTERGNKKVVEDTSFRNGGCPKLARQMHVAFQNKPECGSLPALLGLQLTDDGCYGYRQVGLPWGSGGLKA